nr:hypothetical protein CFP56_07741 [Quercus suber]
MSLAQLCKHVFTWWSVLRRSSASTSFRNELDDCPTPRSAQGGQEPCDRVVPGRIGIKDHVARAWAVTAQTVAVVLLRPGLSRFFIGQGHCSSLGPCHPLFTFYCSDSMCGRSEVKIGVHRVARNLLPPAFHCSTSTFTFTVIPAPCSPSFRGPPKTTGHRCVPASIDIALRLPSFVAAGLGGRCQVMAQTPSPRDHDADANPDLSRKRPRLSEEHDSPVHIEPLDLEEVGTSFVDAIEIEDDNMPSLYSDNFAIEPNLTTSAFEQIRYFRQECLSDHCVHPFHLYQVSAWLEHHLSRTADLNDEVRSQGYLQDDAFFGVFGQACWGLLDRRDETFDETMLSSYPNFGDVLYQFFEQLQVLATRFVQLLPAITTDRFTRRDSAQLKSGHHRVTALCYLHVLRALQVQAVRAPFLHFVHSAFGVDIDKVMRHGQLQFVKNGGSTQSLVTILGNIARNAREVHDAWLFMDSTLLLICSLISSSGLGGRELAEMVESINSLILPAIREKHPRALPDNFHAHVVGAAAAGLRARVLQLDVPSVYRLYEDLVKGEGDALLTTPQMEDRSFKALWTICQENKELLGNLLCTAWSLQVEKSFLFSDIIDVRTCGITLLTQELSRCYRNFVIPQGADHPLVQYTSRFLRVNELIRYIFSADSHASLVGHSAEIVGFLVTAQSYTEQETDILWEACTNSAEVEFAKASCTVLRQVCNSLDREQLLYVARQFASTPVSRISPDIIELLSAVFVGIHTTTPADGSQESRLASAFVSLDMLRHLAPDTFRSSTNILRSLAITELSRYVGYSADDRLKIYETCIADLASRTKHATTSADVLRLFLSSNTTSTEVEKLLDVLPLGTAVNELCAFVQQVANSNRANIHLALMIRLDLILLLMYLTPNSHERTVEDLLFTFLFGDLSLDIYAREEAWKRLTNSTDALPSAQMLLDRYLVEFVPTLHADMATPHLIETILTPLKGRVAADALEDTPRVLTHPLWQALLRFALDSAHPDVNDAAALALRDLLFLYPQSLSSKKTIVQSQMLFASDLVDRLCSDPINEDAPRNGSKGSRFLRTIKLLASLLHVSRTTHNQFLLPAAAETLSVGLLDSSDMLCFKIQLHSSERQAKVIEVRAPSSATVAQLAKAIENFTGMTEHRVILAGKELDTSTDAQSTLSSAGIHSSGVIMISPRYTFNCDLSAILTPPGPIEQIVSEQYHRLERLVDEPKERSVARAAHEFLKTLKPSRVARDRVTSEDTPFHQLFSAALPYRTCHSLHILDCQLRDFAALGTVDEAFIVRTVRRIIWFIMDPDVDLGLLTDTFAVLRTFLCGKLSSIARKNRILQELIHA